ncbi:hypothetical protein [Streptomyces sp. NBC_00829]|uniref:hypothetical protein n=1 Tax=Streptomyces sp. NBC_00829 TaxID=2903679 RepID=UPI00386ACC93|nr:hypothetical protein OG293_02460 [Streptomyces sp. NBC_00829]
MTYGGSAPIYAQLVRERGDIPAEVRDTAERTLRELDRVIAPKGPYRGGQPDPGQRPLMPPLR